jgi:thiol:disulfide interchange protein
LGLDGVKDIRMLLNRDEFEITYDPAKVTVAQLIGAAKKAGYTSRETSSSGVGATTAPGSAAPRGYAVLDRALERARKERKPVVLLFSTDWCVPCKKLARDALSNERVKTLLDRCVFLAFDADKESELAQRMGVEGLPDLRFLKPDGTPLKRFVDRPDAEYLTEELEALLREFSSSP